MFVLIYVNYVLNPNVASKLKILVKKSKKSTLTAWSYDHTMYLVNSQKPLTLGIQLFSFISTCICFLYLSVTQAIPASLPADFTLSPPSMSSLPLLSQTMTSYPPEANVFFTSPLFSLFLLLSLLSYKVFYPLIQVTPPSPYSQCPPCLSYLSLWCPIVLNSTFCLPLGQWLSIFCLLWLLPYISF